MIEWSDSAATASLCTVHYFNFIYMYMYMYIRSRESIIVRGVQVHTVDTGC